MKEIKPLAMLAFFNKCPMMLGIYKIDNPNPLNNSFFYYQNKLITANEIRSKFWAVMPLT